MDLTLLSLSIQVFEIELSLSCEVLARNSFVLKMFFSLPQLFVFLFDVLSVAVFVIMERFVKNKAKTKKHIKIK